jgi:hypothetical protein
MSDVPENVQAAHQGLYGKPMKDVTWGEAGGSPRTVDWYAKEYERLRAEVEAYQRAKQENDERFQLQAAEWREKYERLLALLDADNDELVSRLARIAYEVDEADIRDVLAALRGEATDAER